jgi:hypothetical protein
VVGRSFAKPVSYLLVRVKSPQGMATDPLKRPFVVVDPRAGHGPGIGGFKADSELGVAMRAGHPCYFVGFTPDPMPGQTIEDIIYAEAAFLEKVISLHPRAEGKPCVIGNCQAGWAVMMVAAIRPELFGPIIIPGSPLSYWAGVEGENPMRYTGGLAGGSWITPPQQALGWIVDLYANDDDLRAYGQTIVYAVHDTVGHLGIFVSGGVAKKEHQEFASNIDLIDVLPPGLYEAVLTPASADQAHPERVSGDWIARFEPRTLQDIRTIVKPDPENERRFAAVRRVSEVTLGIYRTVLQPFVKATVNEQGADWLRKMNGAELPLEMFSERNPLMMQLAQLADQVRQQRQPVSPDNPLLGRG